MIPLGHYVRSATLCWRGVLALAVIATIQHPAQGAAQDSLNALLGARLRLGLSGGPPRSAVGELLAVTPDTLFLRVADERRPFLRLAVTRVEVSRGQRVDLLRGVAVGAGLGALVGGAGAFVLSSVVAPCGEPSSGDGSGWCFDASAGRLLAVIGGLAALGGFWGFEHASNHPRDSWESYPWTPARAVAASHSPWSQTYRTGTGGVRVRFVLPF